MNDIASLDCGGFNILALRASGALVAWGANSSGECDAPLPAAPWRLVTAGLGFGVGVDRSGRGYTWGFGLSFPTLPAGVSCVGLSAGRGFFMVLRSDGSITATAHSGHALQTNVPALPTGLGYVEVASGLEHTVGLRSDGSVVAWGDNFRGQCLVPPAPPGTYYTWVSAGPYTSFAGRSDGVTIGWGLSIFGTTAVPPPPPGLIYLRVEAGDAHAVGLLSDGTVVTWGTETNGARLIPSLPTGMSYVEVAAAGRYSAVLRSDGRVFVVGADESFQVGLPALPTGVRYVDIDVSGPCIALDSAGVVHLSGVTDPLSFVPPTLPPAQHYVSVAAGVSHVAALASGGQVRAWGGPGSNAFGQCNVPSLPPGVSFVAVTTSAEATFAIRSDGLLECFGRNNYGQCNAPPPPPGLAFVEVSANLAHALGRLSDGSVLAWGNNALGQTSVPALPPGVTYVEVEAGGIHSLARRSDGIVVSWGSNMFGQSAVPQFPSGTWCVELAAGSMYSVARLSDGSIRIWGNDLPYSLAEYSLPIEGVHWQEIEAYNQIAGRSGPESSYVRHGAGCGGSLPASELIPLDTPRIGDQFDVTLTNLPNDVALLGAGLSATGSPLGALPLPLDPYGAPGCMARISWDAGLFLAGAHHFARASIAVPNMTALIGLRFYHQAIVLDPSANAAGFVVSDATVAVVGE